MKCENCNCDTYIIYIGEEHEKICMECYQAKEVDNGVSQTVKKRKKKRS
ncbi:MAG: hypothetical protein ABIK98_13950 [Pseudomonadota bacterium]|uniref:Uncharacterized protein n=1 Tax=Candidatus Desulfatibia profunda TaxID=2841695 RepID=A0A8J6NSA6_9BACT|nr:hypothetical protein [Candidatus Desulfatibia profunda]MBL7180561.1 hypothetical protein [Desulfobacterales bacterium]MBU0699061.1 hypothetical protein [Pseudomonadota bacterium]